MKKFWNLAIIFLTVLSCCIFSACGDKYANLSMTVLQDGNQISELVLYLDNVGNANSSTRLAVSAGGIDEGIGQISVSSQVSVVATDFVYDGNVVYFTLTANSSGEDDLKIIHMASGKTTSIKLVVKQKSNDVVIENDKIIVEVPDDANLKSFNLTEWYDEIFSLRPYGSSDYVTFRMTPKEGYNKISGNWIVDPEYGNDIIGFERIDNTFDGKKVLLYPVTHMEGYDSKEYPDKTFEVCFVRTLKQEAFSVGSSVTGLGDDPYYLLANDSKFVTAGGNYALDELVVTLADGNLDLGLRKNIQEWLQLYTIETEVITEPGCEADSSRISIGEESLTEAKVAILALAKTQGVVTVRIKLVPKFVGEIGEIYKDVKIKCELNADKIEVYKSRQLLEDEKLNSIDLYDTYSNGLGASFYFKPITFAGEEVFAYLQQMKIKVPENVISSQNYAGGDNSINVLQFVNGLGAPLTFTSDGSGCVESELIDSSNTIYIKYNEIAGKPFNELSFEVVTSINFASTSALNYLNSASTKSVVVKFNAQTGITGMDIRPVSKDDSKVGVNKYSYIGNVNTGYTGNSDYSESIYLNVNSSDKNGLFISNILGANSKNVTTANLKINVRELDVENNTLKKSLMLKQFETTEEKTNLEYAYASTDTAKKYFDFVIGTDTKIGAYSIDFLQEDTGFERGVVVYVYQSINADNIDFDLGLNDNIFAGKTAGGSYVYDGYEADFIAAVGEQTALMVSLTDSIIKSNIVSLYEYTVSSDNATINSNTDNYLTYSRILNNTINLSFKAGTYLSSNQYVKLTITIKSKQYDNIITESSSLDEDKKEILFFIYEPISYSNIKLTYDASRYMFEYLSPYYEGQAKTTIALSSPDSSTLLNYIQYQDVQLNQLHESGVTNAPVVWFAENKTCINVISQDKQSIELSFHNNGKSSYTQEINAQISQFGKLFNLPARILVEKPIITTDVTLNETDEYKIDYDAYGNPYINLRVGDRVKIDATRWSSEASSGKPISNPTNADDMGYIVQLATLTGNVVHSAIVSVDQTNNIIEVKDVVGDPEYYLIVFAKDAMKTPALGTAPGYNSPEGFMMDEYNSSFVKIKLYISDGTETAPYLISDARDFWTLPDNTNSNVYYKVMSDINLNNFTGTKRVIKNFAGHILTDSRQMSLYGLELNNDRNVLFENFKGEIKNLTFNVNYKYNITSGSSDLKLGIFDMVTGDGSALSMGTLEDVFVKVNGSEVTLTGLSGNVAFGGLVAENNGIVKYTDSATDYNYIYITLNLDNASQVYFGGLVGVNKKEITGNLTAEQSKISNTLTTNLVVAIEDQSTTAVVDIKSTNAGTNTAVGSLVGFNYNGTINNCYVSGKIDGQYNVGGAVGKNQTDTRANTTFGTTGGLSSVTVTSAKTLYNVKSIVTVVGQNNVGGVVGYDIKGYYNLVKYQITRDKGGVSGNTYVGGIAGQSQYGIFEFSSVMSYKWKYTDTINATNYENIAYDIKGSNNIGGIIGYAIGSTNSNLAPDSQDVCVVYNSSVNAFIDTESSLADIGGILTGATKNVIFNAYFIGRLAEKATTADLLTNNGNEIKNYVYVANLVSTPESKYYFNDWGNHLDKFNTGVWTTASGINGGYAIITSDVAHIEPIFELAPTSISGKVNDKYSYTSADEVNIKLINNAGKEELKLYYYDFSGNFKEGAGTTILEILNKTYNKYLINTNDATKSSLIKFECEPKGIAVLILKASTSDSRVAYVTSDGYLVVVGTGECDITFTSLLDPSVSWTVKCNVVLPIDGFEFSETVDGEKVENSYIAVDKSKRYYYTTSGKKSVYDYVAETYLGFNVTVTYSGTSSIIISDYIALNGIAGNSIKVNVGDSLSIKVLKQLENDTDFFEITISSFVVVSDTEIPLNLITSFKVFTREGARSISLKTNSAILYPNNETYIYSYIATDIPYTSANINEVIVQLKDSKGNNIDFAQLDVFNIGNLKNGIQEIIYKLTIKPFYDLANVDAFNYAELVASGLYYYTTDYIKVTTESFNETKEYYVIASTLRLVDIIISVPVKIDGETKYLEAVADYTILPQAIDDIEIDNYMYISNSGNKFAGIKTSNVLKPSGNGQNNGGLMIVNMVPYNGYYDYLTIKDITGDEEINFIQTVNDNLNIDTRETIETEKTDDGKGIILKKRDVYYIYTQIDGTSTSKPHTVEVCAYLKDGTILSKTRKTIDVRMLPTIDVQYNLPNGKTEFANSLDGLKLDTDYFASNTRGEFYITTKNADSDYVQLESVVYGNDSNVVSPYEFVQDNNNKNFYYLKIKDGTTVPSDDVGKNIKIEMSATKDSGDGNPDKTYLTLEFTIASFVVHSVSVSPSTDNYIYGGINEDVQLKYWFNKTDISYNNKGEVWNNIYTHDQTTDSTTKEPEIVAILQALNNDSTNDYTYLSDNAYNKITSANITLSGTTLKVSREYDTTVKLAMNFEMNLNVGGWSVVSSGGRYPIQQLYDLRFVERTSPDKPKLIRDENDFVNMSSGETYYILGNDITLKNYTPIDVDILEFDGNGRTITIESFANFKETEIQAGLFKTIYEGMVVKNIKLVYQSTSQTDGIYSFGKVDSRGGLEYTYYDLCNDKTVNYNTAKFGGITPTNNGIITNCQVGGTVAFRATTIENKATTTTIPFDIGGMVCDNNSTGYITNSTSSLNIFAQTDIGGFANLNEGKIVSCAQENATIYTRNSNLTINIEVELSAFVLDNSGEISMSYVDMTEISNISFVEGATTIYTDLGLATMTATDISAGFVYSNSGKVYDSFVNISLVKTGEQGNSNEFYGFVYEQSGTITNAYAFINNGNWSLTSWRMFAPVNTKGLTDCIEVLGSGYPAYIRDNGTTEGLKTISTSDKNRRSTFEAYNFSFGDNETSVWRAVTGQMPQLTSTLEKVEYTKGENPSGTTEEGTPKFYYGLKNIELVRKEDESSASGYYYEAVTSDATYGKKENPIVIANLEAWQKYMIEENSMRYFRIIADLDFASVGKNPKTSTMTFSGNIQGNNMVISNYLLNSSESLDSIGLFKELEGLNDIDLKNSIRNLTLNAISVWATKTETVVLLAGRSSNFNLYNINADASGLIVVGGNAVGGIVGLVEGEFDIEKISSNVGANSTRESNNPYLNVYMSRNNKHNETNLTQVYYAGSVFGILDGYNSIPYDVPTERNISKNYYNVRFITVAGTEINIIANIAGGAFGFVGERVYARDINVTFDSGKLGGDQYSGGVVGENRGVIENAKVILNAENVSYVDSKYVTAGVVGMNLGGLVMNVYAQANIIQKPTNFTTTAGIVGRNFNGTINNAKFDGVLQGYFVGGIIGADYTGNTLLKRTSGSGALSMECRNKTSALVPSNSVVYKRNGLEIVNYQEFTLTKQTVIGIVNNIKNYYWFRANEETLQNAMYQYYVYGMIIGITDKEETSIIENFGFDTEFNFVVNTNESITTSRLLLYKFTVRKGKNWFTTDISNLLDTEKVITMFVNALQMPDIETDTLLYLIGVKTNSFDAWDKKDYTGCRLLLYKDVASLPIAPIAVSGYTLEINGEYQIFTTSANYTFIGDYFTGNGYWLPNTPVSADTKYEVTYDVVKELTNSATVTTDASKTTYTWEEGVIEIVSDSFTYMNKTYSSTATPGVYKSGERLQITIDGTIITQTITESLLFFKFVG